MKQPVQSAAPSISPPASAFPAAAKVAISSKAFSGHQSLTRKEGLVLAQILIGASSKEAGRILSISPRTVEFHRAHIIKKLGAKNTAHLVRIVFEHGE
jgi:DNA-binding CsgD family transcriptional regulator